MTAEDWQRAWEIFRAAEQLPVAERHDFVHNTGAAARVCEEVLALLDDQALEQASPQPGRQYGRYTLVELLGRGGMGEVYSARDGELGRLVALKFVGENARMMPAAVDRLVHEAQSASALNHPNLVTVHEVLKSQYGVALVTELVVGQPLRSYCGRPQPSRQVAAWGAQIARGLAAAHKSGIVHGDIKPENVMVRSDGLVKVLDFGLAQRDGTLASWDAIPVGSFGYMSPEQVAGKSLTAATDVFSLGVVLLELASGKHPFLESSISATTRAIQEREALLPTAADAKLDDRVLASLLKDLLHKEPERRISAAEAAVRLEEIERPLNPRPSRLWLALAASVFLTAAAGWFWLRGREFEPALPPAIPLTDYAGVEWQPALSPDGARVAFVWSGLEDNPDIYVKSIDKDDLRRITTDPREDSSPAWSPDGKWIAYVRRASDGGDEDVFVCPADGGPERLVGRVVDHQGYRGMAWWPDGGSLILRDAAADGRPLVRLFLNGVKRTLTTGRDAQDSRPAVSPDGRTLAFVRAQKANYSVCRIPIAGGPENCVIANDYHSSIGWLGNSGDLLASGPGGIARVSPDGTVKVLMKGAVDDVTVNAAGTRLVFSQSSRDINIWKVDIASGRASKFLASKVEESEPDYSPDGEWMVFRSNRTGSTELYVCDKNGLQMRQLTQVWKSNGAAGSARWSPDGRWIAFDGSYIVDGDPPRKSIQDNIYVVPASGGMPRRLTDDRDDCIVPGWSRDSHWVYYTREHGSRRETWKVPVEGGTPVLVSESEMFDMIESDDGRWLYYARPREQARGIWRRPVVGGPEQRVGGTEDLVYRSWALRRDLLVFLRSGKDPGFFLLGVRNPGERAIKAGALTGKVFNGPRNVALSPDGRTVLFSQLDALVGDLFRIDLPSGF